MMVAGGTVDEVQATTGPELRLSGAVAESGLSRRAPQKNQLTDRYAVAPARPYSDGSGRSGVIWSSPRPIRRPPATLASSLFERAIGVPSELCASTERLNAVGEVSRANEMMIKHPPRDGTQVGLMERRCSNHVSRKSAASIPGRGPRGQYSSTATTKVSTANASTHCQTSCRSSAGIN